MPFPTPITLLPLLLILQRPVERAHGLEQVQVRVDRLGRRPLDGPREGGGVEAPGLYMGVVFVHVSRNEGSDDRRGGGDILADAPVVARRLVEAPVRGVVALGMHEPEQPLGEGERLYVGYVYVLWVERREEPER